MKSKIYAYLTLFLMFACVLSCKDEDVVKPQAASTFTTDKTTAQVDELIQFSNTSQNATAFTWSFGDGTTSKEVSPKKAYQSPGTYLVNLVSTGEGGTTISNATITIIPSSAFTVDDEDDLVTLAPVQFSNAAKGATSYLWTFGDEAGSSSTDESPSFIYSKAGTYTVTLKAITSEGSTSFDKEITVNAAGPTIYFSEVGNELLKELALSEDGKIRTFLNVAGQSGAGLAYDEVHGKIYFSDFTNTGEGKIWSVNLDGTELTAIATGLVEPYGVAVDAAGGKVYWVDEEDDNGDGHVSRANLDGSNKEDLVTMADAQFRSVALDLKNHKMYFYEVNLEDLYIADLDGGNVTSILSGVYGYSILVDTKHDKIYFDDQEEALLKRADLDGSNVETVDDNGTSIYGMAIDYDNDKLYWSGRDSGTIEMADLDGANKVTLASELASPRGIFLKK